MKESPRQKKGALQDKILFPFIIIDLLIVLLSIAIIVPVISGVLKNTLKQKGLYIAESVALRSLEYVLTENQLELIKVLREEQEVDKEISYLLITDLKGKVICHSFKKGLPTGLEKANALGSHQKNKIILLDTGKYFVYDIAVPLTVQGVLLGSLRVGVFNESIPRSLSKIIFMLIALISLAIFIKILVSFWFTLAAMEPVKKLQRATEAMMSGDLSVRVRINSKDELEELGDAFNATLEKLEQTLVSKDELSREVVERKRAENAALAVNEKLEQNIGELAEAYTKLKESQEELLQSAKFGAIGQLASSVAHEVRNPLAIIMQSIEYLDCKVAPEDKEIIQMAKNNIQRANTIVATLLDFAKAKELNVVPVDINSIIEDAVILTHYSNREGKIEIVKELGKDLPQVLVDRQKIEQVLVNVNLNALQAMPKGGTLFLRTYLAEFNRLQAGGENKNGDPLLPVKKAVIIEIEDEGVGISEENLKNVFRPFFTTKEEAMGVGLGLSVAKDVIAMHNGQIEIKSKLNQGTKVIITLVVEGGA
ncbi:MAG: HAMP domain-containing protein [Candidatus Omnitrophica bacterium]|nr:HAMP domain-containing protein [Candidatus Omnitrophota bacterium]MBU4303817.1 HAMP domain-containing protein [Candidatus Omnitrophota bacterium]MBU4468008.1 HAMP domain-containing protein [Candidatus Omnitrophota bacterium]MCG2707805.1 ATP-binding protein [Candidatus Omnitrophota bacterium]